jgi:hypothetical protein
MFDGNQQETNRKLIIEAEWLQPKSIVCAKIFATADFQEITFPIHSQYVLPL